MFNKSVTLKIMEAGKIDLFISTMNEKFPSDKMMAVRAQLEKLDDSRFPFLQSLNYKNPTTLLIISIFLGWLGVDRFMLGQAGLGVLKLITCGGFGIWAIVDWFLISGMTKDLNYQLLMQNAV
jgi:TM2 domain-containing membrane protein YozV